MTEEVRSQGHTALVAELGAEQSGHRAVTTGLWTQGKRKVPGAWGRMGEWEWMWQSSPKVKLVRFGFGCERRKEETENPERDSHEEDETCLLGRLVRVCNLSY